MCRNFFVGSPLLGTLNLQQKTLRMTLHFNEDKELSKLTDLRAQEAEELAQTMSGQFNIPYVDLSRVSINTDALRLVKEADARRANLACFGISGKKVVAVVVSPANPYVKGVVDELTVHGYEILLHIGSPASLARAWGRYQEISESSETKAGQIDIANDKLAEFAALAKTIEETKLLVSKTANEKSNTSAILEVIIAGALGLGASDIHIEPEETHVRLRYRLDGVLTEISTIATEVYRQMLSRLKLVSALKLNIKNMRQDGRFSIKISETSIEVRTSIIPGGYGEAIVLRILNPEAIHVSLESLGMNERLLGIVQQEIAKPNGMLLTTGPTGSGKTTTLYSFLQRVNNSGIKIITIEDPIEYHLPGVTQTQTDSHAEYTFNEGLKSALRQDPDIIMIGEIRDSETAATAVDAALTGHLVFSTLHTNNAFGAIPRLLDLGINPKVIGPAINLMLAQRLIRKLCSTCREEATPNEREQKLISKIVAEIQARQIAIPPFSKIWRAKGCSVCSGIGYKGRIGIFEGVLVDQSIEEIVSSYPGEAEIARASEAQKILSMQQDGIVKLITGITTLEELERVVSLE